MITLKKDKELLRLDNWCDLEDMAGFMSGLDPNKMELREIIGRYSGEHGVVKCGLKNCGTPHSKGYIVVTSTGHITNIGNICGKNYFGVDFATMSNQLDRDLDDRENRERINDFVNNELDSLKNWLYITRKNAYSLNKGLADLKSGDKVPRVIQTKILNMIKNRSDQLTIDRELTDGERRAVALQHKNQAQKIKFVTEKVAIIYGIEALYPQNDLKNLLVDELDVYISQFEHEQNNIHALNSKELKKWVKWINGVSLQKQKISAAIELGKELFTYRNLIAFEKILSDREDKIRWKAFLQPLKFIDN